MRVQPKQVNPLQKEIETKKGVKLQQGNDDKKKHVLKNPKASQKIVPEHPDMVVQGQDIHKQIPQPGHTWAERQITKGKGNKQVQIISHDNGVVQFCNKQGLQEGHSIVYATATTSFQSRWKFLSK